MAGRVELLHSDILWGRSASGKRRKGRLTFAERLVAIYICGGGIMVIRGHSVRLDSSLVLTLLSLARKSVAAVVQLRDCIVHYV